MKDSVTSWFGYFDAAYLINLDSAPEWIRKANARLHAAGIPFERFPALTLPEHADARWDKIGRGNGGCALSHRAVLQMAYERGPKRVLIFEDDVVFRNDLNKHMPNIIRQLSETDWDIFYLGLFAGKVQKLSRSFGRVWKGWHTQVYGISRKAIPPRRHFFKRSRGSNEGKTYATLEARSDDERVKPVRLSLQIVKI